MLRKYSIILVGLVVFAVFTFAACGNNSKGSTPQPDSVPVNLSPPAEYKGKSNPYTDKENAVSLGMQLYQANCSSCHGEVGMGDGPAGSALAPKASALAQNQHLLTDDYLYWRIAEGGIKPPFYSAMPAWKTILSEEQIWQIVSYIRTLEK